MVQYRIPVEETFSWQRPVLALQNDPPGSPVKGQRYIVGAGTGVWVGHDNNVAWYDGTSWKFDVPLNGWCTFRIDVSRFYRFDGANWVLMESGLGDLYMLKATYDSDADGIVDSAETVDDGAGNVSTAIQVKAAVVAAHTHANKIVLDAIEEAFTTALKAAYNDAVAKAHEHLNKAILDAVEVAFTSSLKTAYDDAVSKAHEHSNKAILDAVTEAFTSVLKGQYDLAYSRMGQYDPELGVIIMNM